jgi:tetratricopeptide (TPR) repeat protein
MSDPLTPSPEPARRRTRALVILAAAALIGAALAAWSVSHRSTRSVGPVSGAPATFLGSDSCASCHAPEHAAWKRSQHARAMQHASPESVRGNFENAHFTYNGVTSTFFRREGRYYVRTDGADGQLADFEVKFTFGLEPLQQYLVELPGGRVQALSIAWDTRPAAAGGGRWFHLYPDDKVGHADELHWTGRQQNWNFMCADCHSVDVHKNYDPAANRYATRYAEVPVGCEACHGPGSAHAAWAQHPDKSLASEGLTVLLTERRGVHWAISADTGNATRSAARTTDTEIGVCAPCHARRAQVADDYRAGRPWLDDYLPALLTAPLYYPDGQQKDEVYIWASFLESRMYAHGVTCSDCHDPHSGKARLEGDALCGQCHSLPKYASTAHHHHAPEGEGARCVSCHMPTTTYMQVDARRDHSLRIPDPAASAALGTPNACNACHRDQDPAWAAATLARWNGHAPHPFQDFGAAFAAADAGHAGAGAGLAAIARDAAQPAIVRASAVTRLAATPDDSTPQVAAMAAQEASPLLRLAALTLVDVMPPPQRESVARPLLGDPVRSVRIEAARVLAPVAGNSPALAADPAWQRAQAEYVTSQNYNADRPESRVALGTFLGLTGQGEQAAQQFAAARALDPAFAPAYVNEADLWRALGADARAGDVLRAGLKAVPQDPSIHYAAALWLIRAHDRGAALAEFAHAAQLGPQVPRYAEVYGIALNELGQHAQAVRVLEEARRRWPQDPSIRNALAAAYHDNGQEAAAAKLSRVPDGR